MEPYHYRECGLDNVYIEGIEVLTDDDGDDVVVIPDVVGLHRTIARRLVQATGGLNGKEVRFLRTMLGMTQAELAAVLHVDHQTVGRWERSETQIQENADTLLRLMATQRLKLDELEPVEDVAKRTVPSARAALIEISAAEIEGMRSAA